MLMQAYYNLVQGHLFKMIMSVITIQNPYYHIFSLIIFNESYIAIAPLFLINLET
jgi:hypothetical protein